MFYQVALHDDCVRFNGQDEYPDGWLCVEAFPAKIVAQIEKVDGENQERLNARIRAAYEQSTPRANERQRYVKFSEHFVGMTKGERSQPQRKTDDQKGMWIPEWLLKPAQEVPTATRN